MENKKHLIAASNFLLGPTNFLILPLPENWHLGQGLSPPEINSNTTWGEAMWVTSGRASHLLYDPHRKVGLEFEVKISKGQREPKYRLSLVKEQGAARLGKHEGHYILGEVKRGFPRRKTAKTLRCSLYCPETKRTIDMEFVGECSEEDLAQIFEAICGLECH